MVPEQCGTIYVTRKNLEKDKVVHPKNSEHINQIPPNQQESRREEKRREEKRHDNILPKRIKLVTVEKKTNK